MEGDEAAGLGPRLEREGGLAISKKVQNAHSLVLGWLSPLCTDLSFPNLSLPLFSHARPFSIMRSGYHAIMFLVRHASILQFLPIESLGIGQGQLMSKTSY